MKMKIGVGLAALSALAAEGKNFDRDELNAMLDKLAASPEPESAILMMMATCYVRAMPRPVGFDRICLQEVRNSHGVSEERKADGERACAPARRGGEP